MTINDCITKTRRYLKDNTQNVWKNGDIQDFINEGLMVVKNTLPEYFTSLVMLADPNATVPLADEYINLPSIFAAARCFEQDEQNERGIQKMNEFEARREEMREIILNSDDYTTVTSSIANDYVTDIYYAEDDTDVIPPLDP